MIFIFHSYAAKAYIENNMPGGNCLRENFAGDGRKKYLWYIMGNTWQMTPSEIQYSKKTFFLLYIPVVLTTIYCGVPPYIVLI